MRGIALGTVESFDCRPSGGEVPNPEDAEEIPAPLKNLERARPVWFRRRRSTAAPVHDPQRGVAPLKNRPGLREGDGTAVDPNPGDPRR